MDNKTKLAVDMFNGNMYCSQAVLCAFCETYGMDFGTASRISCGLNSGCRSAEICGAVSGAILVIGLKYGGNKSLCNSKTEEFIKCFKDANKSTVCRDILGCDISQPAGREKAIKDNLFKTKCADIVKSAAQILVDLGYENYSD